MMGGMSRIGGFGNLGWLGMILNLIITVGVIVGIVWVIVWIVRRTSTGSEQLVNSQGRGGNEPSPKEILQSRYVRGEINREQYQQILTDLS